MQGCGGVNVNKYRGHPLIIRFSFREGGKTVKCVLHTRLARVKQRALLIEKKRVFLLIFLSPLYSSSNALHHMLVPESGH